MLYKSLLKLREEKLNHIAIIMDGNGRWAKKKGKMRIFGHKKGFEAVKKAVKFAILKNLKILTLYAFSSENWSRPLLEISELMELFFLALDSQIDNLNKYNIRLKVIGDTTCFDKKLQNCIYKTEKITLENDGLILNIAANYGGKWDIIQSVKKIVDKVQKGYLRLESIQEETLSQFLSTSDLLPVDLVIRTGGEQRLSNFLLWQIAYSELYFTDILWPDFDQNTFQKAIDFFISRDRRFGGLNS